MRSLFPRVIHNDAELKEYTDALFQLTGKSKPTRAEQDAIDLLSLLIERYEAERYDIPQASRWRCFDSSWNSTA